MIETADALAYLHNELIVHGGVRAENLLISGRGHVLLAGLSSAVVAGGRTPGRTFPLTASYRWSSPEYLQTGGQTFASDVFAFGMTIYEARDCCYVEFCS